MWITWHLISVFYRSYYEANDVTSAIEIVEEAFSKHQSLVSMEDVNIAAELYISSKQYDKALAVRTAHCISSPSLPARMDGLCS